MQQLSDAWVKRNLTNFALVALGIPNIIFHEMFKQSLHEQKKLEKLTTEQRNSYIPKLKGVNISGMQCGNLESLFAT